MKSPTYTDVKKGSFAPLFHRAFTLTPVGICVGVPVSHGFPILTCGILAFPSGKITGLSTVVLQCGCSTAAAMRPQYPGDGAHPKVRLKSDTRMPCGDACRVVAGASVDVVEVAVVVPCIEEDVALLEFSTTVVEPEFIAVLA